MKRNRPHRRAQAAFTLLEVLLVLVILTVLGSMAVVAVSGQQDKADRNTARAQVQLFDRAVDVYRFDMRRFPDSLTNLVERPTDSRESERWGGPYIKGSTEILDPWDNEYRYEMDGDSYRIWSLGPDGQDGSDDDIASDDEV